MRYAKLTSTGSNKAICAKYKDHDIEMVTTSKNYEGWWCVDKTKKCFCSMPRQLYTQAAAFSLIPDMFDLYMAREGEQCMTKD